MNRTENRIHRTKSSTSNARLACAAALLCLGSTSCGSLFNGRAVELPPPTVHQENSGLRWVELMSGSGSPITSGDRISIHYEVRLEDGTVVDSSYERGLPAELTADRGEVFAGWDQGMLGLQLGGKRRIFIPSELAYGPEGIEGSIPPNAPLEVTVEYLERIDHSKSASSSN